jgi:hypothetical protein
LLMIPRRTDDPPSRPAFSAPPPPPPPFYGTQCHTTNESLRHRQDRTVRVQQSHGCANLSLTGPSDDWTAVGPRGDWTASRPRDDWTISGTRDDRTATEQTPRGGGSNYVEKSSRCGRPDTIGVMSSWRHSGFRTEARNALRSQDDWAATGPQEDCSVTAPQEDWTTTGPREDWTVTAPQEDWTITERPRRSGSATFRQGGSRLDRTGAVEFILNQVRDVDDSQVEARNAPAVSDQSFAGDWLQTGPQVDWTLPPSGANSF